MNLLAPALAAMAVLGLASCSRPGSNDVDWPVYGGVEANRYSPLEQIDRTNVHRLQVAWQFTSGEPGDPQTHPLVIGRTMYVYTPSLKVVALDATTGSMLWTFDSGIPGSGPQRGMTYWSDGKEARLFASVMHFLYALDPATGKPIAGFGNEGRIDLREGLRGDPEQHSVTMTSPGALYKDLIIVGFRTSEAQPAPPGDIRAFDVRTGKLRWTFHTIPHPGESGHETWSPDSWKTVGAANNWAGMTVDRERGIVFVPTGSAASDFYGADRIGDNLFANSLLALDATTGRRLWHFQFTRHDIWDRDLPAQPALLTVQRDGKRIDAVAQTTKQGFVYVFDRETGESLFPLQERSYPSSDVPGEITAPTQTLPLAPEPFARQRLTADLLSTRTPAVREWALDQFRRLRSGGQYLPFALEQPTVLFPGYDGGAEWGGAAVDPASAVIYINSNDIAWTGTLVDVSAVTGPGANTYMHRCSACHGLDRKGSPPAFPSLEDIHERLTDDQIAQVIHTGRGRMPPFPALEKDALADLLNYLRTDPQGVADTKGNGVADKRELANTQPDSPQRYRFTGYHKFLDPDGYPAVAPPWGTLNAIDLNTGRYLWKIPLGEYPELAAQGLKNTGTENYGGPVLTAGGLLFIGATIYDQKLRAFNSATGELLWETRLPYAGVATPVTYSVDGKQYVVISTSNARNRKAAQGHAYVAFALP